MIPSVIFKTYVYLFGSIESWPGDNVDLQTPVIALAAETCEVIVESFSQN